MAAPVLISVGMKATGQVQRSIPFYVPNGTTLAQAQAFMTALAVLIDNVSDGIVSTAFVTLPLTVPGGIKTTETAGCELNRAALLGYSASGTNNKHSIPIYGWAPAGFSGKNALASGAYGTLEAALTNVVGSSGAAPTDRFNNDLVTYLSGKKIFRK